MKKISVYADARLLLSAVGGIIYRRSLFVLPTVDSKVLGTWRTGAHRHRVADAIDFVAIAITLAMLATSPTTSRVFTLEIVWIYEKNKRLRCCKVVFECRRRYFIHKKTNSL